MSDYIKREDAIHILACEMYAEAQSEGYDAESVEDYIPEATAWMSDAPSAEVVLQTPQTYGKSINPNTEIMSDLISREAAREAIEKLMDIHFDRQVVLAKARDAIVSLPSADRPTGRWIPTSEGLPDSGDTFLVTVMVGTERETDVASSFGSYIDGFWDTFTDWIEDEECHVLAWMPLPEPYKGGEEE